MTDGFIETPQPQRKQRGRPWAKGQSGNPAGRRLGCRNRATLAAEQLLDGEAEGLVRKAVELAHSGDTVALRLCLDRTIAPRRERPVPIELPPVTSPADLAPTMGAIAAALARGAITSSQAAELAQFVDTFVRAIDASDFEGRLQQLERYYASRP